MANEFPNLTQITASYIFELKRKPKYFVSGKLPILPQKKVKIADNIDHNIDL
jgi:hypothetical protein